MKIDIECVNKNFLELTDEKSCEGLLNNIPTGLLIIKSDEFLSTNEINMIFINDYALKVLKSPREEDLTFILKKFTKFNLFELNSSSDSGTNLLQFIKDSDNSIYVKEKFIFNEIMICVKVKKYMNYKLITIEDFSEERKLMEKNLFKNIRSQFLITISHEINNPMNSLINTVEEITNLSENNFLSLNHIESIKKTIETNLTLIKFFIRNFIIYVKVATESSNQIKSKEKSSVNMENYFSLEFLLSKTKMKFKNLFLNKNITLNHNFKSINNVTIRYDYYYTKWLFKNIFIYFFHMADKLNEFRITVDLVNEHEFVITFELFKNVVTNRSPRCIQDKSYCNDLDVETSVKTNEMYKDIIISFSTYLNLKVIFLENNTLKIYGNYFKEDHSENDDMGQEFSPRMSIHSNLGQLLRGAKKSNDKTRTNFENLREAKVNRISSYESIINYDNLLKDNRNSHDFQNLNFFNRNNQKNNSSDSVNNYLSYNYKYKSNQNLQTKNTQSCKKNNEISKSQTNSTNLSNDITIQFPQSIVSHEKQNQNEILLSSQFKKKKINFSDEHCEQEEESSNQEKNILIVDDESFNLKIMSSMLRKMKVKNFDTCTNGLECLEKVKEKKYSLIFMDVMMPSMDGIEASKKIQDLIDQGKLSDINIVIISAHSVDEIKEKAKRINAVKEFLSKPVNKTKIAEILEKYQIF